MAKLTSKRRWRTDALAWSLGLRYHAEARVAAQQLWGYLPLAPRSNDLTNNAHPLFYHPANRGSRPVQPICSGITNHFQPEARKDRQMHWKFTIYHPLLIFNWDIACDKQGGIQWDQIIYLQWTYHDISYLQSGGSMNDFKSLVYYDYMYITEHRCDIPSSKDAGNTI